MAAKSLRVETQPSLAPSAGAAPVKAMSSVQDEFQRAISEHQRDLMTKAICLTRNDDEARDLVQDTLVRGMRALHKFQPGSNMRAWLMRILVNIFIDRCRERSSRPQVVPLPDGFDATPAAAVDPEADSDVPMSARVTFDQLNHALEQLEPTFRRVYELRITRRLSYEQISQELNIPVGTVGTRLSRARERLCRLLKPALDDSQVNR